ncbi:MAG TPA: oligosaccharide flippase family protein [Dehalococcoidia bacterium]
MIASMQRRWTGDLAHLAPRFAGTLGASGAGAALGIVSGTVAARVLGPAHRGELAQLLLWPQLVVTLGILGVELACTYLSADATRTRNMPATALTIALAQSVVLVVAYLVLVPFVFAPGIRHEALMMTPLIPLYLAGAVSVACLSGRLRFAAFNTVRIALPIAYTCAIVALASMSALSPATAAAAYLGAHAFADVLALFLVWRESGLGRFERALAGAALKFGARAHFGRMSPQSLGIDVVIISLMLSSHDVGLYAAATAFLTAPNLIASSIGLVVFPQVSATHQAGAMHQTGARQQLNGIFALYAASILAISGMLIVFAGPIVTLLFGSGYAGAVPALRLLALGAIATSLRSLPIEVLRGVGRPGLTSFAEAANWLIFLAALPIGVAAGGLVGMAAAAACAAFASLGALSLLVVLSGVASTPAPQLRTAAAEASP